MQLCLHVPTDDSWFRLWRVKPVLNTTSRCLHEHSWSFMETSGTSTARPNTLHQHFEALHSWDWELMSTNSLRCFWLAGLDFRATLTLCRCACPTDHGNDHDVHSDARHFYLVLPLRSFDVGREWKVYLSACERYTVNFGIQPIQNTPIDLAVATGWTL